MIGAQPIASGAIAELPIAVGGGASVTGSLSVTESGDTLASTALVALSATLAVTESGDTLSSSATIGSVVNGTLAVTEGADTAAGTGTVGITGTLARTEAADTGSGTGTVGITGTLAATESADTGSGTGTVGVTGNLARTDAADTAAGVGAVGIGATLSATDGADTSAGTGTVLIAAAGAATEAGDTLSSSGTVVSGVNAVLAVTEAGDTVSAGAVVVIAGSGAATEAGDTVSSAGTVLVGGRNSSRNLVPNSTLQGAVVGVIGSGGVSPTNWILGAATGISKEVVALGTLADGRPYIDVRTFGTNASGVTVYPDIYVMVSTVAEAYPGQTFTAKAFVQLVAGTHPSSLSFNVSERSAAGGFLAATTATYNATPQYVTATRTFSNPSAAFVSVYVNCSVVASQTVDFTIRLAAPQLELGATATAYLPTYGVAAGIEEAGDTLASTAPVAITGTLASTESGDTVSGVGTIVNGVNATLAVTEAGDTVSALGTVQVNGSLAASEIGDTVAGSGSVVIAGVGAATEVGDSGSAQASISVVAQLARVEAGDTLSSLGFISASSYTINNARANLIYELALLHGLVPGNPLTVSATARTAGALVQTITGTDPVTVTTVASDVLQGSLDAWIDALAAVHGLTAPLVVTGVSRSAGSLTQTLGNDGTTTTVTTV